MENKTVMDQFAFFEDQPLSRILQLAAPVNPYLQLAQPNFQDYNLKTRDLDQP